MILSVLTLNTSLRAGLHCIFYYLCERISVPVAICDKQVYSVLVLVLSSLYVQNLKSLTSLIQSKEGLCKIFKSGGMVLNDVAVL